MFKLRVVTYGKTKKWKFQFYSIKIVNLLEETQDLIEELRRVYRKGSQKEITLSGEDLQSNPKKAVENLKDVT